MAFTGSYAFLGVLLWLVVREHLPRAEERLEQDCLVHHCERSLKY